MSGEGDAAGLPVLSIDGARATLRLNRPAQRNRLSQADLAALRSHFEAVRQTPGVRVLVLTASGPCFCAGYDLGEFGGNHPGAQQAGPRAFEDTVMALEQLPLPTVCALNGSVYGGATDLALACDFRIGVDALELRMPAARIGLHYYPSGLSRYVARLGLATAKRLLLLAETLPASELLRVGYLDEVVPADELAAAVDRCVDTLTQGAPLAVNGMKQSLDEIARGEADEPTLRGREALTQRSEDLREGLRALAEKRPARFTGG